MLMRAYDGRAQAQTGETDPEKINEDSERRD
jgi:hypothetical protein